jgi:hypothetical protein
LNVKVFFGRPQTGRRTNIVKLKVKMRNSEKLCERFGYEHAAAFSDEGEKRAAVRCREAVEGSRHSILGAVGHYGAILRRAALTIGSWRGS